MIDLFWIAVCLIGWGILAACWLIDKRKASVFMDAQSEATDDREDEIMRLRREIREQSRSLATLEDSQPITVGDRETDPISVEIAFFRESDQIVVHAMHPLPNDMRTDGNVMPFGAFGISFEDRTRIFGCTKGIFDRTRRRCLSVGLADSANIEHITDAVRRYNEAFHQSKGVEDAGTEQEGTRANRDRTDAGDPGADHDHDREAPRRQGATRD